MKTLCFPPLVVATFGYQWTLSVGGNGIFDVKAVGIVIRPSDVCTVFSTIASESRDIERKPSQTLLDLLANWQHHKFDMPIYDCILEEYPELGDYL